MSHWICERPEGCVCGVDGVSMSNCHHFVEKTEDEKPNTEAIQIITKLIDKHKAWLASCERMVELLQPEWDKMEANENNDLYVSRTYADNFSSARKYRKEIAELETILKALNS